MQILRVSRKISLQAWLGRESGQIRYAWVIAGFALFALVAALFKWSLSRSDTSVTAWLTTIVSPHKIISAFNRHVDDQRKPDGRSIGLPSLDPQRLATAACTVQADRYTMLAMRPVLRAAESTRVMVMNHHHVDRSGGQGLGAFDALMVIRQPDGQVYDVQRWAWVSSSPQYAEGVVQLPEGARLGQWRVDFIRGPDPNDRPALSLPLWVHDFKDLPSGCTTAADGLLDAERISINRLPREVEPAQTLLPLVHLPGLSHHENRESGWQRVTRVLMRGSTSPTQAVPATGKIFAAWLKLTPERSSSRVEGPDAELTDPAHLERFQGPWSINDLQASDKPFSSEKIDVKETPQLTLTAPNDEGLYRLVVFYVRANQVLRSERLVGVESPFKVELLGPTVLAMGDQADFQLRMHNRLSKSVAAKIHLSLPAGVVVTSPSMRPNQASSVSIASSSLPSSSSFKVTVGPNSTVKDSIRLALGNDALASTKRSERDYSSATVLRVRIDVELPDQGVVSVKRYAIPLQNQAHHASQSLLVTRVPPGEHRLLPDMVAPNGRQDYQETYTVVADFPPVLRDHELDALWAQGPMSLASVLTRGMTSLWLPVKDPRFQTFRTFSSREQAKLSVVKVIAAFNTLTRNDGSLEEPKPGLLADWVGAKQNDIWMNGMVLGFLLDARAEGYTVPDSLVRHLRNLLLEWLAESLAQLEDNQGNSRGRSCEMPVNTAALTLVAYELARFDKISHDMLRTLELSLRPSVCAALPALHLALALNLQGSTAPASYWMQRVTALSTPEGPAIDQITGSKWFDMATMLGLAVRHSVKLPYESHWQDVLVNRLRRPDFAVTSLETVALLALDHQWRALSARQSPWQAERTDGLGGESMSQRGLWLHRDAEPSKLKLLNKSDRTLWAYQLPIEAESGLGLSLQGLSRTCPAATLRVSDTASRRNALQYFFTIFEVGDRFKTMTPDARGGLSLEPGHWYLVRMSFQTGTSMPWVALCADFPGGLELRAVEEVPGLDGVPATLASSTSMLLPDPTIDDTRLQWEGHFAAGQQSLWVAVRPNHSGMFYWHSPRLTQLFGRLIEPAQQTRRLHLLPKPE